MKMICFTGRCHKAKLDFDLAVELDKAGLTNQNALLNLKEHLISVEMFSLQTSLLAVLGENLNFLGSIHESF